MLRKTISVLLLSCMLFAIPSPVKASAEEIKKTYSESELLEVREKLNNNFVPENQQDKLIEKLENGEAWDCMKESELEKVPDEFNAIDLLSEPYVKKYYRFEDGSYIMIQTGEEGKGGFKEEKPLKRGSSSTSYGTTYWDWRIERNQGDLGSRFYFDGYLARYGAGKSKISAVKWGVTEGFGATEPKFEVARAEEVLSPSQAALGRMWWQSSATVSGGWGPISGSVSYGQTCELWLALVRGQMYVDAKLPY
jgi:hypothetical protein